MSVICSHTVLASFSSGAQGGGWSRGVLQEFQDSDTVASGEDDAFIPSHDFFGDGQCRTHYKTRKIQMFVRSGGGEKALLLTGSAQLDPIVACRGWRRHKDKFS
jgi:hypothetical protein